MPPDNSRVLSSGADGTLREWDANSGTLLKTIVTGPGQQCAVVDFPGNRILHATPEAWRLLGREVFDPEANRRRLLPAEFFGPLPAFP